MKYLISLVVAIIALINDASLAQTKNELSEFQWLVGTWERINTKPGTTSSETWQQDENKLTGIGLTLQNSDTTFVENLRIIIKDDKIYYVAEVSHNDEPTYFEITSQSPSGFTCENPKHDFPKLIEYVRNGNAITVTISGDGKSILFNFIKEE